MTPIASLESVEEDTSFVTTDQFSREEHAGLPDKVQMEFQKASADVLSCLRFQPFCPFGLQEKGNMFVSYGGKKMILLQEC